MTEPRYVAGACNIGPDEIALRRRVGHAGLAATAVLAAALVRSDLHPAWRLTLALPAAGSASGYLQARQRFCADFGYRGVYNFGRRGHEEQVTDERALALDRRRALRIAAVSAAIGLGVALASMALPPARRLRRSGARLGAPGPGGRGAARPGP
jgi:hypothetical protein